MQSVRNGTILRTQFLLLFLSFLDIIKRLYSFDENKLLRVVGVGKLLAIAKKIEKQNYCLPFHLIKFFFLCTILRVHLQSTASLEKFQQISFTAMRKLHTKISIHKHTRRFLNSVSTCSTAVKKMQ